ncbi:unnamed protein product [Clonostachys byssicola]|uniref:Uncharacterized protein n=1 Tax=Clonostachys byssicola TaxID=160290 RepID=A0A9N9U0T6_9HYPO|nr:unnamed protein product [Clonostachys byssicola]
MTKPRALTHPVRQLIILSFIPNLVLSVANAVISGMWPIVGLPILAFSTAICAGLLLRYRRQTEDTPDSIKLQRQARCISITILVFDAACAVGILAILVFTWKSLAGRESGQVTLTTYATIPYLFVFFNHSYLAVLNFGDLIGPRRPVRNTQQQMCPQCDLHLQAPVASLIPGFSHFRSHRECYRPVTGETERFFDAPDFDYDLDADDDEDARVIGQGLLAQ